ncbi:MAG: formate/nitrite transporter family protein [Bacilli bacterium]|nr:formate/nitrite transporter family protein [Bacilli bacterium]
MNKLQVIAKSAFAGLLIGLAAIVFVLIKQALPEPYGLIVGSCMFSIGLISVILLEAYLFTGKVGYINSKETLINGLISLPVNLIVAFAVGLIFRAIMGTQTLMNAKLALPWYEVLFKGIITGALIYLAVELYKHVKSLIVIILPVMAFILSGSLHCIATGALIYLAVELYKHVKSLIVVILPVMAFILSGSLHCIAEAAYIGMCELNVNELLYILLVILGNSIGSLIIRGLQLLGTKLIKKEPEA